MQKTKHLARPAPVLAWAGAKSSIMPTILSHVPDDTEKTIEPLVGGGAFTFAVDAPRKVIADANPLLIAFYETLRDEPQFIMDFWRRYSSFAPADFEASRNAQDAAWDTWVAHYKNVASMSTHTMSRRMQAAWLFFLNHTCFNGLFRVNAKGEYNVPPGFIRAVDPEVFLAASSALQGAVICCADVVDTLECTAGAGDLVYLDPPYSGSFVAYTKHKWTVADDERLAACVARLTRRGVRVMISASAKSGVAALYSGMRAVELSVRRNISVQAQQRSTMAELLLLNF